MTSPEANELSFADLVDARRRLNEDVQRHRESVNYFASASGFVRTEADRTPGQETPPDLTVLDPAEKLGGVTTALTCFESLQTAVLDPETSDPSRFSGLSEHDRSRLDTFVSNVAQRTHDWKSEGAARRYCIVRASAPILRLAPPADRAAITRAVKWVWQEVSPEPGRAAIYEVATPLAVAEAQAADPWSHTDDEAKRRYPPNAFLTFWGLAALQYLPNGVRSSLKRPVNQAELWLNGVIGREIAYQYSQAPQRDPQQLAWALSAVVRSRDEPLADRGEDLPGLVEAGFKAFFTQQQPDGSWETGRALFHYPEAGNAYCYIYETLAELVALAVDERRPFHDELRRVMLPYLPQLLSARGALIARSRRLGTTGGIGWTSGHHPHRTSPESWATATAYRFLQMLRRFVGGEVRHQAAVRLHARRPRKNLTDLASFGRTWNAGSGSAGDLLGSLFVHPTVAHVDETAPYDPDRPQLSREWARSAVLYGPPGTGKTTLAESVAGALGWDFVEITPAEFLDRGMEMVSARADEIFRQLNELDRAVVLFDEIDELIRRRGDSPGSSPTDMIGRFFTTTMLPRLARLWSARRVIFFANTNSIQAVDSAVKRSQRFDASIFVMPPSLERRMDCLPQGLKASIDTNVFKSLLENGEPENGDGGVNVLAWFPFLRFDQLERLHAEAPSTVDDLGSALERFGAEVRMDWPAGTGETLAGLLEVYRSERQHQRMDPARARLVARNGLTAIPAGFSVQGAPSGYLRWLDDQIDESVMDGAGRLRSP